MECKKSDLTFNRRPLHAFFSMAVEILERFSQTSDSSSERIDRYPPVGVGHQEVVTHNLDCSGGGELGISLPVVLKCDISEFLNSINLLISHLVKGILDGEDGVVLDESLVHLGQLVAGDPVLGLALGVLEVQVVLAVLAELARRNVHSNEDLAWGEVVLKSVTIG